MVSVCLLYLIGVIITSFFPFPYFILLIGLSVALSASVIFYLLMGRSDSRVQLFGRLSLSNLFLIASLILLGGLRYSIATQVKDPNDISQFASGDYVQVVGTVVREPDVRADKVFLTLRAESLNLKKVAGLVRVTLRSKETKADYGSRIIAQGILRLPSGMRNPGEFDYREHLRRQGVDSLMDVRDDKFITVIGRGRLNYLIDFALSVKAVMTRAIDRYIYDGMEEKVSSSSVLRSNWGQVVGKWIRANSLPEGGRGILKGVLLGDVSEMPSEVQDMFTDTGTVHVLVVSGSNVALIVAILYLILRRAFRVRSKTSALASIGFVILYLFITGAQPPVLRASVMAVLALTALFLERDADVYNILAISAFAILVWNPLLLYDPSFQLSVSALLGVVYLTPLIERWFRPLVTLSQRLPSPLEKFIRGTIILFSASLGAQIATTPIIVFYFNRVSIISLAANLIVVPLSGLILPLGAALAVVGSVGLVSGPLGFVFGHLASFLGYVSWGMVGLTTMAVKLFAQVPYASLEFPPPDVRMIITYYAGIVILLNLGVSRWAKKGLIYATLVLGSLWVWVEVISPDDELRVTFLDVGQGDSAFVRFPDGSNMLIDGGGAPGFKRDVGKRVVNPFLLRNWALTIDRLVVSHPDLDHLKGLLAVLENRRVKEVIDIGANHPSRTYGDFLQLVLAEGVGEDGYRTPYQGMVLGRGKDWQASILYPESQGGKFPDVNNNSIVIKITYGEVTLLFVGDIEKKAEEELVATFGEQIDIDILKAPHHGSKTSSSSLFLKTTTPETVIVSVGLNNRYNHPSPEVIERYKDHGIDYVYRTDENGAITVITDGRGYRVETAQRN